MQVKSRKESCKETLSAHLVTACVSTLWSRARTLFQAPLHVAPYCRAIFFHISFIAAQYSVLSPGKINRKIKSRGLGDISLASFRISCKNALLAIILTPSSNRFSVAHGARLDNAVGSRMLLAICGEEIKSFGRNQCLIPSLDIIRKRASLFSPLFRPHLTTIGYKVYS